MDSWLLRLLSEKHENKKKQISTNKQLKSKKIIESKKQKKNGNTTPTLQHLHIRNFFAFIL